jgi:hypothetical protein
MISNEAQFQRFKESQKRPDSPKGVICECVICGEHWGGGATGKCAQTCKNCRTVQGRNKIYDQEYA